MTERLATGTTAANGADFTISAGASPLFVLKNSAGSVIGSLAGPVIAEVKIGSLYFPMTQLDAGNPGVVLHGGAADSTWRWRRVVCTDEAGVEQL